ncbi:MAG: response regulator [Vicinamibacterales bacterium]
MDDEAVLVTLGERMLSRLGHRVSGFRDPIEALDTFKATPDAFDALVTDFAMPRMSGTELARAVRQLRPELPVVLVTGRIGDDDRAFVSEAGVSELVLKPFGLDQLAAAIERALAARVAPTPAAGV